MEPEPLPATPPAPVWKSRYENRTFATQQDRDRYDAVYHGAGGTLAKQTGAKGNPNDVPYPIQLVQQLDREAARVQAFPGILGQKSSKSAALRERASLTPSGARLVAEKVSDTADPVAQTRTITIRVTAGGYPIAGASIHVDGMIAGATTNDSGILKVLVPHLRESRLQAAKTGYTMSEMMRLEPKLR